MSSIMSVRNWCSTNSFSGRSWSAVRRESQAEVRLTSSAVTDPITCPGTSRRCIRHSGSRASPTLGYCSAQAQRLRHRLEVRPAGLDVEQQQGAVVVRGADVELDGVAGDVVAEVAVGAGRGVGHRHDQLVDRRDRLAGLPERPGRAHQPLVHHGRRRSRRARPARRCRRCRSRPPGTGCRRRSVRPPCGRSAPGSGGGSPEAVSDGGRLGRQDAASASRLRRRRRTGATRSVGAPPGSSSKAVRRRRAGAARA